MGSEDGVIPFSSMLANVTKLDASQCYQLASLAVATCNANGGAAPAGQCYDIVPRGSAQPVQGPVKGQASTSSQQSYASVAKQLPKPFTSAKAVANAQVTPLDKGPSSSKPKKGSNSSQGLMKTNANGKSTVAVPDPEKVVEKKKANKSSTDLPSSSTSGGPPPNKKARNANIPGSFTVTDEVRLRSLGTDLNDRWPKGAKFYLTTMPTKEAVEKRLSNFDSVEAAHERAFKLAMVMNETHDKVLSFYKGADHTTTSAQLVVKLEKELEGLTYDRAAAEKGSEEERVISAKAAIPILALMLLKKVWWLSKRFVNRQALALGQKLNQDQLRATVVEYEAPRCSVLLNTALADYEFYRVRGNSPAGDISLISYINEAREPIVHRLFDEVCVAYPPSLDEDTVMQVAES